MPLNFKIEDKTLKITGNSQDAAKLYLDALNNPSLRLGGNRHFELDRSNWRGTLEHTVKLLENKINPPTQTNNFKLDKVLGAVGNSNKRKRVNSDLDGDWEYDRRALDNPFILMRKEPTNQTIWIEVDFCFSAMIYKSDIDKYADFVFQVIQAIENRGFICGVRLIQRVMGLTTCNLKGEVNLIVKQPGEYADKRFFRFFTTEFFRRVIFFLEVYGCEKLGLIPDCGLGIPSNTNRASATKGLIKLTPGFLPEGEFIEPVIKLIKQALGA